jgi:hypothetical protein
VLLSASPLSGAALAGEFDLLAEGTPTTYVLDDAAVLNKTTKKSVGDQLRKLEVSAVGGGITRGAGCYPSPPKAMRGRGPAGAALGCKHCCRCCPSCAGGDGVPPGGGHRAAPGV